jgi:hypothetical protein
MIAMRGRYWWVTIVWLLLRPATVPACPVCFSAVNERVLSTYHLTAALMTLLPLVILGSIIGWLYLRFRSWPREVPEEDTPP